MLENRVQPERESLMALIAGLVIIFACFAFSTLLPHDSTALVSPTRTKTAAPVPTTTPTLASLDAQVESYFTKIVPIRRRLYEYLYAENYSRDGVSISDEIDSLRDAFFAMLNTAKAQGTPISAQEDQWLGEFQGWFSLNIFHLGMQSSLFELEEIQMKVCVVGLYLTPPVVPTNCTVQDIARYKQGRANLDSLRSGLQKQLSQIENNGWQPFFRRFGLALPAISAQPTPKTTQTPSK